MKASSRPRAGAWRFTTAMFAVVGLLLAVSACSSDPSGDDASPESDTPDTTTEDTTADQDDEAGDGSSSASQRPDGLPDEMPIPDYASYAFELEPWLYFQADVSVEVLIEDMERLLEEHGWEIVDRVEQVAWGNDVLLRVEGHGHDMDVYIEPAAGSETESQVAIGPGGGLL